MNGPFSKRVSWTLGKNDLSLEQERKRQAGIEVLDLTESNPTRCGFSYLAMPLLEPLLSGVNLRYAPESQGMCSARNVISEYYTDKGCHVPPDDIFLVSSSSEAYSHLFRLVASPSDRVLVPKPGYPLFEYIADLCDVELVPYLLLYANGWSMSSLAEFTAISPQAVILVHPNNPTGNFILSPEKEQVIEYCMSENTALIVDEVFLDYSFTTPQPSFAVNQEVLTFTVSGISKVLGLPQMKLSWIVVSGPEELKKQARDKLEIICDTFLSINTPVQQALPQWFALKDKIQTEIRSRVVANRQYLESLDWPPSLSLRASEGGWYAVICLHGALDDEAFALRLLREQQVLVHPGYFFDFAEDYLVLSLLPREQEFQEGVSRMLDCADEGG